MPRQIHPAAAELHALEAQAQPLLLRGRSLQLDLSARAQHPLPGQGTATTLQQFGHQPMMARVSRGRGHLAIAGHLALRDRADRRANRILPANHRHGPQSKGWLTDTEAVAKVQAGDRDAYRVLVERHGQSVFRLAYRITRNEQDAEDLVQEAFLRAYRHIHDFDGRASFPTWIYRIAANASLDLVRGRKRVTGEMPELRDPQPTPERQAAGRQMHQRLEQAMGELSLQERAAFVMRHFENLSIAEIAASLDLRENATKHSIFRAVRKLRAALGEAG